MHYCESESTPIVGDLVHGRDPQTNVPIAGIVTETGTVDESVRVAYVHLEGAGRMPRLRSAWIQAEHLKLV